MSTPSTAASTVSCTCIDRHPCDYIIKYARPAYNSANFCKLLILNDLNKALEVFKLEQFVICLPVEIHRWIIIDKKPATISDTAKLADEFAILYKSFPTRASVLRSNDEKRENFGFGRDSCRGAKAHWSPNYFRSE